MTIDCNRLTELMAEEDSRFARANPASAALAERARANLYGGVPMHWMSDWGTPFPLFVAGAHGAAFDDVDGHRYADFCYGDTGAMFGHSPNAVAAAMCEQAVRGYTTMLPSEDAVWVGEELGRRFGLPFWQVATTASDANRCALRWARAATGRSQVLVFDGCYHGTVDETFVRRGDTGPVHRPGLIGQAQDLTAFSRVVDFNDLAALESALQDRQVAAVLCEPALTNVGMVLPDPGYHAALRELTRKYGTLLIIDETHTISTAADGYTGAFGLEPDMFVLGKPIAGGIPCAVYGISAAVAERMQLAQQQAATEGFHGHTGMGTTLSANVFSMRLMRANLGEVMTEAAYAAMLPRAERLAAGLRGLLAARALPWCVTQLGARCELQFCPTSPRTAREAEAAFNLPMEHYLHLALLNRGAMITPFHNMMLVSPATTDEDVDRLLTAFAEVLAPLLSVTGRPEGRA